MLSLRIRRFVAILALTAASMIFPLSDLSAAPRSESRWSGPERTDTRIVRQGFSFWNFLTGIFEGAGMRIDGNG
ncbi:MAG TPA: hypothetical protein VNM67_07745 [Thermoanaerobaculia bacterium]|jgi:hypothetical protein|nr:hypothetical protein [Thermoanaerobaculia bacterium]